MKHKLESRLPAEISITSYTQYDTILLAESEEELESLSYPLSFPFPPAFILSQHQGLFQGVSSSHQLAKVLEFQLQQKSFQ